MSLKLEIFDLDGTLLDANSSAAFCCYLVRKGVLSPFWLLYAWAVELLCDFGIFTQKQLHEKVFNATLKGRPFEPVQKLIAPFLAHFLEKSINPSTHSYLRRAQTAGDRVVLLSNSPSFLVGPIADYFGIKEWAATEYHVDTKGSFCHIAAIMDGPAKAAYAKRLLDEMHLGKSELTAYSDSFQDIPLLEMAEKVILVNPDRRLRQWRREH